MVGNYTIFYLEAGDPSAPAVLLFHGFSSSSHQYRHLIPILALFYHVIAPDFPGFGFTTTPSSFPHTFANIATVMGDFLDMVGVKKFAMYIFDYGAPVGLRLALERPGDVTAIVSQSGNAYVEGFGAFWDQFKPYWETGSEAYEYPPLPSIYKLLTYS
jgi:pimeloyl-ACP methyl ester carboxylesterase